MPRHNASPAKLLQAPGSVRTGSLQLLPGALRTCLHAQARGTVPKDTNERGRKRFPDWQTRLSERQGCPKLWMQLRALLKGARPAPEARLPRQRRHTPACLQGRDGPYRARLATASAIMRREAWALASRLVATSSSMGPEAGLAVQKGRSAARSSAKDPARQ